MPAPKSPSPLASPHVPPPPRSQAPFFKRLPPSGQTPGKHAAAPSALEGTNSGEKKKNFLTTKRVVWISIAGVFMFIILALGFLLCMPKCCGGREEAGRSFKTHQVGAYRGNRENLGVGGPLFTSTTQTEKGK